ncbi:2OG-Fe(II) oxygenase [Neopusillimonas aromaticivorans]|uniref:2OG-Fe(II) oxygenase n=1 Tax=Neopusillimonas aromaticivorans TaxID=2979868 RepID=UPI003315065F
MGSSRTTGACPCGGQPDTLGSRPVSRCHHRETRQPAKQPENSRRQHLLGRFQHFPFNTHPFTGFLAELRQTLNQQYYLGLRSEEFHLARYDSGYGYSRHLDQHRNSPHRKISAVLYLNDDWNDDDGGELCLYETTPDAEAQHVDTPKRCWKLRHKPSKQAPRWSASQNCYPCPAGW